MCNNVLQLFDRLTMWLEPTITHTQTFQSSPHPEVDVTTSGLFAPKCGLNLRVETSHSLVMLAISSCQLGHLLVDDKILVTGHLYKADVADGVSVVLKMLTSC